MNRLRKFLDLPIGDRWLLLKACALLATVRILLRTAPYPAARRLLESAGRRSERLSSNRLPAKRLAWAVTAAAKQVPGGGHCLSQALTLQVFLSRRGYPCQVCFGVDRDSGRDFMAHAWVEHEGAVLIGGDSLGRLVRLTPPADSRS
jgi:hypothetical protein